MWSKTAPFSRKIKRMDSPARSVLKKLEEKGMSLGSVESLTAGLFASTICEIPGASKVFKGAIVSYDNSVKTHLAEVQEETIDTFGVVSQEVADEMALGGARALFVDVCVSFTGNAGPTAEPGGAKVGDVFISVAFGNRGIFHFPCHFKGTRNSIRQQCVDKALEEIDAML